IDKIVNPNNRNPALEEDEDPSRYVRTKPPTIKPEGYFKLMSPHDFEVELSLEFAHMLRDYMKEFLKKKEKFANIAKQKEKALARIGKSMDDDIPSAIGGTSSPSPSDASAAKAKGPTPFQQKKLLQKQNTTAITTGLSQAEGGGGSTPHGKRKSMGNILATQPDKALTPRAGGSSSTKKRDSSAAWEESQGGSKTPRLSSKSQTTLDVTGLVDAAKKEEKQKRSQPKGKVGMPTKPVEGICYLLLLLLF
ncbi:hypothetical protein RFI_15197, partial [Reticulomyxa filosa]